MNILITSVGTATGVGLIKALKKTGRARVLGADTNPYGYTAGSMLADGYFQVPAADAPDYLDRLEEIAKKESVDYLVPVHDLEIERIGESSRSFFNQICLVPPVRAIQRTRDKLACSLFVEQLGIPIPKILNAGAPVKKILRDRAGVGSRGIWIYEKGEKPAVKEGQFLQEYTEGEEYTVDVLSDREGRVLYAVPRIRLEVKAGVATKVKIEQNEELARLVGQILGACPIPGFSNVQFIKKEGRYYFIEINCRFSGCGAATLYAAPKAADLFLDVLEGRETAPLTEIGWETVVTRYYEEVGFP